MTSFLTDIKRGKIGENIFIDDFLDFFDIEYQNVSGQEDFQIIDCDFSSEIGTFEIKTNYRDNKKIIFEEFTNYNEDFGKISFGWFYKSKAKTLVFVSEKTRILVFIPFNEKFKNFYEEIKDNYKLILNKVSYEDGKKWQSAFRVIPLDDLQGFYSMYKKL